MKKTDSEKKIRWSVKKMAEDGISPHAISMAHGGIVSADEFDYLNRLEVINSLSPQGGIKDMNPKKLEEIEKECLHPRGALITTHKGDIRCAKCKKLWVAEKAIKQSNIALLEKMGDVIGEDDRIKGLAYGDSLDFISMVEIRNSLRASQRLKLDEIRKSL